MIQGLRHIGIVVQDLDKALTFWCDVLGFRVARRMEERGEHIDKMLGLESVRLTTVKLSGPDDNIVELLYFHSHRDASENWVGTPYSTGLTHIALSVDNLDDVYCKLHAKGFEFPNKPQYSPDGAVKMVYAKGPEGLLIELVEVIK